MDINLENMSEEQKALLNEFQNSGLSADEFIKKYFAAKGIKNPDQVIAEIDSTLSDIDYHYSEIKKAKEKGIDRKSYLRGVCDSVFANADAQKAGAALGIVTKGIEGKEQDSSSLEYDGFEAASLISDLDTAIVNSTLEMLSEGDAKNE